jgi:hypothetical protein
LVAAAINAGNHTLAVLEQFVGEQQMDYVDIKGWVDTAKAIMGLLATAKDVLLKGKHRDDVEAKLPAHVMLRQDSINSHVCPNPACNRRIPPRAVRVAPRLGRRKVR